MVGVTGPHLSMTEAIVYASGNVCDQCSVAAAVWVIALPSGRTLVMCGHHMAVNRQALLGSGALVYRTVIEG